MRGSSEQARRVASSYVLDSRRSVHAMDRSGCFFVAGGGALAALTFYQFPAFDLIVPNWPEGPRLTSGLGECQDNRTIGWTSTSEISYTNT